MGKNCCFRNDCKITFIVVVFTTLILLGNYGYALPVINNITLKAPIIRLGETNSVIVNCTDDNENYTISNVYADINATNVSSSNNSFEQMPNGAYNLSISTAYTSIFWVADFIKVTAYCINDINETASAMASFRVINQTLVKDKMINVSVDTFDDGRIGFFEYSREIRQYSRMNITMEFINTGSTSYMKKTLMQIGIYDSNFTVISNRSGLTNGLWPGDRSVENLRYVPLEYGFFWMHIIVSYANKTAEAWGSFYVKPYYDIIPSQSPAPAPPPASGGNGGSDRLWVIQLPTPEPAAENITQQRFDAGLKGIILSYPEKVYLMPGESAVAYVTVYNNGTLALRELKLLPSIIGGIQIDVRPMILQTLYGNHSAIFMITLDAPVNTKPGTYPLDLRLSTDKGERYGYIDVEVGTAKIDDSIESEINNYQYIISKLEDETDTLDIEGKDTAKIKQYINDGKATLKLAKDTYKIKDYDKTHDNLKKTRNHLIDAVMELARSRSEEILVVMAPTIWLLIALLIIITIAAVSIYVHKRDVEKERKKAAETTESTTY